MGDTFTLKPPTEREEGAWEPIPDNSLLTAKVLSVAKTLMPFKDRDTGEDVWKIKWSFQVTQDGPFQGRKVQGQTSLNFVEHADCKFYQWVKALFNQAIPEGFTVDTDDLANLDAVVLVEAKVKPRSDGKGDWVNNNVIDVRPARNVPVSVGSAYGNVDYTEEPF